MNMMAQGPRRLCFLAIVYLVALPVSPSWAGQVGVNYGRVANDLPSPSDVAQFVSAQGIGMVKIFDEDSTVIQAFANTQIKLTVGLPNQLLEQVANDPAFAYNWLTQNVTAYYPATEIVAIAVGNEVLTSAIDLAMYVVPAMINLHVALVSMNLDQSIKISSPHSIAILESSYPPSAGRFNASYDNSMLRAFFDFLIATDSFAMVNVYPFFAYSANPTEVPLTYALFMTDHLVTDPSTGLRYRSLLDAQLDAFLSALTGLNESYANILVSVTETGWPSLGDAGELGADVQNAQSYNGNLVKRVLSGLGTPMRPNASMDAFVFALFNENEKPGPTSERNYGLFYPNWTPVYNINFRTGDTGGNGTDGETPYVQPPVTQPPATSGASFCVAKPDASPAALQAALDYACGPGRADCEPLQPGNSCYNPNTLTAHASYAFNSYYQMNGQSSDACYFGGIAEVMSTSPSTGSCTYPSG